MERMCAFDRSCNCGLNSLKVDRFFFSPFSSRGNGTLPVKLAGFRELAFSPVFRMGKMP